MRFPVGTMAQLNVRNDVNDSSHTENRLISIVTPQNKILSAISIYNNDHGAPKEIINVETVNLMKKNLLKRQSYQYKIH